MRKISTIVAIVAAVIIVGACTVAALVNPALIQPSGTVQQEEIEDCDAEDWANREDDCGFVGRSRPRPARRRRHPRLGRRAGDHLHRVRDASRALPRADLPIRWCRARCYTCNWNGPRVTFAETAERHRRAHLYVGRHRA